MKFYEKGELPLEIVTSRQWYIRNGSHDPGLRQALRDRGDQLQWVPDFMRHRYMHWVDGLAGDWLISRQRFFGVPFPVWYPLDARGVPQYDAPLLPTEEDLPIDPASDTPVGYREDQRDQPTGFTADPDAMDTWATSSLTPEIACGWQRDPDLFARTYPMDMNAHAHEIIRTWLFGRVLRAHLEHGTLPWQVTAISGFVVDPDRKKMSKSKANTTTPSDLLTRYGADAVRWRAASTRPGMDSPFEESGMKVGRRLATKLLNASRFVLGLGAVTPDPEAVNAPLDHAMLRELAGVVEQATAAFESYDYTTALETTERFFWRFCDDYLELVKERAYAGDRSTAAALALALSILLRLFAPIMPFVTEEVWSWWRTGSVHRTAWPQMSELGPADSREQGEAHPVSALQVASRALSAIRGAKSARRLSMRTELAVITVRGPQADIEALDTVATDILAAAHAGELRRTPVDGRDLEVEITLPS